MAAFVLALGIVTIITVQMSGAVLYITSSLPPQPFLKVMTRYLRREGGEAAETLPPFELRRRLARLRRCLAILAAAAVACGAAAGTACGFLSPGAVKYVVPSFLAAALNALLVAGVFSLWIRQLRRMPDPDA